MADQITRLDSDILHFINVRWANPILDQFWLVVSHLERQPLFLYVALPVLIMLLLYIYGWRLIKPLAVTALSVGITDLIAYRIFKQMVHRPRPFENLELAGWLRKIGDAHGPSFPSNHAANCFAGAVILSWYFPAWSRLIYIFAGLVAYSRLALGVHYPSDVIGGILLGCSVGLLIRILLLNRFPRLSVHPAVSIKDVDSSDWRLRSRRLADD